MTPTLLPLWRLIGISASMSNCKVLPTQIMLGLLVPVVTYVNVFATNVCRLASTSDGRFSTRGLNSVVDGLSVGVGIDAERRGEVSGRNRELPKAHAQKNDAGSFTARRSRQGFFLSFSDRRFACIGCGKPCGPYCASPWRRPAGSSSAKSPAWHDLSPKAEWRPAEESWDCASGNPEAVD